MGGGRESERKWWPGRDTDPGEERRGEWSGVEWGTAPAKLEAIGWMATFQHPAEGWGTGWAGEAKLSTSPFLFALRPGSSQRARERERGGREWLCFGEASNGNTGFLYNGNPVPVCLSLS
jgi:hypothetical protein